MSTLNDGDGKPELPIINSKDFEKNETLEGVVQAETPIKEWLVNYVGETHNPDSEEVTVEMIVETMSEEFPEFLLALAEENWIRGYRQGIADVDQGMKLAAQEAADAPLSDEPTGSACVVNTETDCTATGDTDE